MKRYRECLRGGEDEAAVDDGDGYQNVDLSVGSPSTYTKAADYVTVSLEMCRHHTDVVCDTRTQY